MCGFVGSASIKEKVNEKWLLESCKLIFHRGPDDKGIWLSDDSKVGLGHRRLSIIDLSNNARQPLFNYSKDVGIVFNGEIYNFPVLKNKLTKKGLRFFSNSDTEVLLKAYECWGYECLSKINGMFSFAIYDKNNKKIFAARDISGQKPFFYTFFNDTFLFGSDLKTIASNPKITKNICIKVLDNYLLSGHTPSNSTLLEGISKLPPAHAITYDLDNGNFKSWKYWEPPKQNNFSNYSLSSNIINLENIFDQAVSSQLVSDVPVGICLSGGIDSSLITAFASRHLSRISTFTAVFPNDKKYDESKYANLIADHFSTDHNEIIINYSGIDIFEKIKYFFDEPLADSSSICTFLLYQELSKFCKVALGGDGSDEIFGGYSHHYLKNKYLLDFLPKLLLRKLNKNVAENLPLGFKGRNFLLNLHLKKLSLIPPYPFLFDFQSRKELLDDHLNFMPKGDEEFCKYYDDLDNFSELAINNDFNNYLCDDILVKTDRSSMANSLEVRSPFLDKFLIEYCYKSVPNNLKAYKKNRKIILKELGKKYLPDGFDNFRKKGFSLPFSKWLKDKNFKNFLYDKLISKESFFNKKYIKSILKNQDRGFANSERIFSLLVFELWRENLDL